MSYNCRIYMNTGFNAANIPATPSVLERVASSYRDIAAIEIMQQRFLGSIRVSATWEQVQDADYIRVGTLNEGAMYYFVNTVTMLATDVAEMSISLDAMTSVGGVNNIKVLDGETERWTGVEVGDSDDPLLAPSDTMEIVGGWMFEGSGANHQAFYECTLDIGGTAQGDGKTYTDQDTGLEVTVPFAKRLSERTHFRLPHESSGGIDTGTVLYCDTYVGTQQVPNKADEHVANLRSLGLEDAVVSHVIYPDDKVNLPSAYGVNSTDDYYAAYITGKDTVVRNLPIDGVIAPSTVENYKHINNSDFCKMGLLTCAGDKMEFLPKEIDLSDGVRLLSDPHTDGKVYYRFNNYKGNNTVDGFWLNCVAGMKWKQTPLTFNGKSGSAIDYAREANSAMLQSVDYQAGRVDKGASIIGSVLPSFSYGESVIGNASYDRNGSWSVASAGTNTGMSQYTNTGNIASSLASYFTDSLRQKSQRYAATKEFGLSQIALPTIKFPYSAETLRDLHNNGVYVYQYKYTNRDITRINKLLKRYGKKYISALSEDMLVPQSGDDYVYIRATGVSVTHKTISYIGENWINNAISEQLEGGIRIWAVSPISGTV